MFTGKLSTVRRAKKAQVRCLVEVQSEFAVPSGGVAWVLAAEPNRSLFTFSPCPRRSTISEVVNRNGGYASFRDTIRHLAHILDQGGPTVLAPPSNPGWSRVVLRISPWVGSCSRVISNEPRRYRSYFPRVLMYLPLGVVSCVWGEGVDGGDSSTACCICYTSRTHPGSRGGGGVYSIGEVQSSSFMAVVQWP